METWERDLIQELKERGIDDRRTQFSDLNRTARADLAAYLLRECADEFENFMVGEYTLAGFAAKVFYAIRSEGQPDAQQDAAAIIGRDMVHLATKWAESFVDRFIENRGDDLFSPDDAPREWMRDDNRARLEAVRGAA